MKKILLLLCLLASFFAVADNVTKSDILRGCVARYQYHGNVYPYGTIHDASERGNNGTFVGNTFVDSNGINLEGGAYITINPSDVFDFGTGDFSVCTWVKLTNPTSYQHLLGTPTDGNFMIAFNYPSNNIAVGRHNIAWDVQTTYTMSSSWTCVSVVRSSGVMYIYVNNTLISTTTNTNTYNTSTIYLGNNGGNSYFTGRMDDMRLYNKALTSAQITEMYNNGRLQNVHPTGITNSDCVGWYGYTASGTSGTWYDISGNGNNGTLVGNAIVNRNGLDSDGVGSYASISSVPIGVLGDFCFSFWIYPRTYDKTNSMVFELGNYYSGGILLQQSSSNHLKSFFNGSSVFDVSYTIPLNQWNYIVFQRSSTSLELIVNLSTIVSISNSTSISNNLPLRILADAYNSSSESLNGICDDFRVYNRALSTEEIKQRYNSTKGRH